MFLASLRRFAGSISFLLILLLAVPASSAVFDVTKQEDTLDGTCGDDCSLREAVTAANESAGFDTILVPPGTYVFAIDGRAEDQARTGDLDILDEVEIIGAGADQTFVDADGLDRVFEVAPRLAVLPGGVPLTNVSISALTIRNGEGTLFGGGIRIGDPGSLVLSDCAIRSNVSTRAGGIYMTGSALTVERCVIAENVAGGSVLAPAGGLRADAGTVQLINTTVSGNLTGPAGAGIVVLSPIGGGTAVVELTNVTLAENGVAIGGTLTGSSVFNTIIEGGCEFDIDGVPATSLGGNVEGTTAVCFTALTSDQTGVSPASLALQPLTLNGGPTETHALGPTSVALDTGLNLGCPTEDQRGLPRPGDGDGDEIKVCDVGAYERPDSDLLGGLLVTSLAVSGPNQAGATIFYTATVVNEGTGIQLDDPNSDELRDVLPVELTLVDATADRGLLDVFPFNNAVTWNGQLFSGEQAVITIEALVNPGPTPTVVVNQGIARYDDDGDGVSETNRLTDDPALPGIADPTQLCVFRSSSPLRIFADGAETGDLCYWSNVVGLAAR